MRQRSRRGGKGAGWETVEKRRGKGGAEGDAKEQVRRQGCKRERKGAEGRQESRRGGKGAGGEARE